MKIIDELVAVGVQHDDKPEENIAVYELRNRLENAGIKTIWKDDSETKAIGYLCITQKDYQKAIENKLIIG